MTHDDDRRDFESALEPYLTAFSETNSSVFSALDRLSEAEQGVKRELLKRVAGSDLSFVCERCGALVWIEIAESSALILVEADGTPHEDRCHPASEVFGI